ncbi:MAG TPA: hypothetical protein VGD74_08570, partial [Vulgatibacter sp.]
MLRSSAARIALSTFLLVAAACGSQEAERIGPPPVPASAVVAPGELQRFFAPEGGLDGWSATCGAIVEDASESVVWRAPQAPGRCTIVGVAGGARSAAVVEVREPVPTVTRLEGMAEPPARPEVVDVGADGTLYLAGWSSIAEFAPGSRHWEVDLSVPPISARTLSIGVGGDLVAVGTWQGRAAVLRRLADGTWMRGFSDAGIPSESFARTAWSSAVAPDGSACVLVEGREAGMYCTAGRSGPWVPVVGAPEGAFTFDREGRLIVGGWLGDVFAVEGGEAEYLGASGLSRVVGIQVLGDALFLFGREISRWSPAEETWRPLGDPTPDGWVASLALLGDRLFALTYDHGLFRLSGEGRFEHVADRAPLGWFEGGRGRIFAREGSIQMPTAHGIWRLDEAGGHWELSTRGGYGYVRRPHSIAFLPDGTTIFGGGGDSCEGEGVYRRAPGSEEWRALEGEVLPDLDHVRNLALRDDGALAFANGWNAGSNADGIHFAAAGALTYEPLPVEGLPGRSGAGEP